MVKFASSHGICNYIWFMIDSFKHKGMRRKLVEEIRQKGVNDSEVLAAIEEIPRHFFWLMHSLTTPT